MADDGASKSTPFYLFDRDSPGWLHRRVEEGEEVLAVHVARILEANPALLPDDVIRDHAIRGLRGELKAKRGPKPHSPARMWRIIARYEDLVEEMISGKKPTRRTGPSPEAQGPSRMGQIHEIIAKEFKLGGALNVRNLISSQRNPKIAVRAKRRKS